MELCALRWFWSGVRQLMPAGRRLSRAGAAHGDGVCTVGRSSGKLELVSLKGVLRPGTGKLQSGSAGLDLRKATCGPVPRSHKPYKVAGPRLSRRIYPPRANQMTSATASMARMMSAHAPLSGALPLAAVTMAQARGGARSG